MPAHLDPPLTRVDQHGSVEVESLNRRSTNGGSPNDEFAALVPCEVLVPRLAAWMIQRLQLARGWVETGDALPFGEVTVPTGKAEVRCLILASKGFRDNVIDGET